MTKKQALKAKLIWFLVLNAGLIFTAAGISIFKTPNHFAMGGTSGLAIILADLFPRLNVGGAMMIINLVLVIFGFLFLGRSFGGATVYASAALSVYVELFEKLIPLSSPLTDDTMLELIWAVILPAFAAPIGLFLMKQFMEGLPMSLIESAKIDGAKEFRIFWTIVMPNVKPAWLTLIIFSVQNLWNAKASAVIYSEAQKTLVYALQQIQAGGIARTGQAAAVTVVVMAVPILIFILSQSQILETMATSGLKD